MGDFFKQKEIFPLISCFVFFLSGCATSGPGPTAATSWNVTRTLPREEEQRIAVTVLGSSTCPNVVQQAVSTRLKQATQSVVQERALNLADVGINALYYGAFPEARQALDETLNIMEATINTDSKTMKEALALNGSENIKLFKGEPYERAICCLYRGLIYFADGDYENARACFQRGEMQTDTLVNGKATAGDWLSLKYLQALASWLNGDVREPQLPKDIPAELAYGEFHRDDNTLLIVTSGFAPIKIHEGKEKGKYGLSYKPVGSQVRRVRINGGSKLAGFPQFVDTAEQTILALDQPTEDIFIQALSKGRREMDKVLEAKKQAADSAKTTADVAESVSQIGSQFGIYGLPVTLLGAALSTAERERAAKADSIADLRQISSVPAVFYMGTFKSSQSPVKIETLDQNGNLLCTKEVTVPAPGKSGKMNVVLVRVYQ